MPTSKQGIRLYKQKMVAEAEKQRLALLSELSSQASQVHGIAEHMVQLFDEYEDNSLLEQDVFKRHMLEAGVMQRAALVMPTSMREAKAYSTISLNIVCPHALNRKEFVDNFYNDIKDKNLTIKADAIYVKHTDRKWDVYRDPDSRLNDVYVHTKTGTVQVGLPFDNRFRLVRQGIDTSVHTVAVSSAPLLPRQSLLLEDWSDHERKYHEQRQLDRLSTLQLLSDSDGGVLYYCPKRDAYSSDGKFDMAMYDLDSISRHVGKKEGSKKRAFKHQLSKALISRRGISSSGSDRNVWIRIPPLISRLPAASKKMNESILMSNSLNFTQPRAAGTASPMTTPNPLQTTVNSFNISAVTPGIHHGIADFESFLHNTIDLGATLNKTMTIDGHTVDDDEMNRILDCFIRDDSTSLTFERCLTEPLFEEYKGLIIKIAKHPTNPVHLYQLGYWLLLNNLGKEAYAVIIRGNEVMGMNKQLYEDYAICQLIQLKLGIKYRSIYSKAQFVSQLAHMCPEYDVVLAQCAMYMHRIRYIKQAEQIFIGALLNNSLCVDALRGYAHLLIDKGNYQVAHRYLCRVQSDSISYCKSQLEIAWLNELMGVKQDTILQQYRSCISLLAGKADSFTSSLIYSSTGHFYHARGDIPRAVELYKRSIHSHPDNAYAYLLYASVPPDASSISITAADSYYRKGLFMLKGKHRWTALMAYGEFVSSALKDHYRAEHLLREAVSLSFSQTVWPCIALAHFLHYTRGQHAKSSRLLKWVLRKRRKLSKQ